MNSTAVTISFLVSGVLMLAWLVWGVREYRRSGNVQWLWMAALLGVSLLVMLSQLSRWM